MSAKIQLAIGPHEDLLTIGRRRKLKWYGHVSRSSGLAKAILQGTVKGGRGQGKQKKRWEDNIKEWTGPEFARSKRAAAKTELVVKSSVVPQRPPQFRDNVLTCRAVTPIPVDAVGAARPGEVILSFSLHTASLDDVATMNQSFQPEGVGDISIGEPRVQAARPEVLALRAALCRFRKSVVPSRKRIA